MLEFTIEENAGAVIFSQCRKRPLSPALRGHSHLARTETTAVTTPRVSKPSTLYIKLCEPHKAL